MKRYEVIPHKYWRKKPKFEGQRGIGPRTVSLYGALPNGGTKYYEIVTDGYTIRDNRTNQIGNISKLQRIERTHRNVKKLCTELNA